MTKFVALLTLFALICHNVFFKQPTLGSATTGLVLAGLFGLCAVMVVKEWFEDMVDA